MGAIGAVEWEVAGQFGHRRTQLLIGLSAIGHVLSAFCTGSTRYGSHLDDLVPKHAFRAASTDAGSPIDIRVVFPGPADG